MENLTVPKKSKLTGYAVNVTNEEILQFIASHIPDYNPEQFELGKVSFSVLAMLSRKMAHLSININVKEDRAKGSYVNVTNEEIIQFVASHIPAYKPEQLKLDNSSFDVYKTIAGERVHLCFNIDLKEH